VCREKLREARVFFRFVANRDAGGARRVST
jgi:hypothetical protein